MPELPEVESTVRYLRERVLNAAITGVQVNWKRSLDRPSLDRFKRSVIGSAVIDVQRRGKYIVMSLARGAKEKNYLLGHLRMSGSIDVISAKSPIAKHDRIVLEFKNGKQMRFNDPRKFGRFYLVQDVNEVTGKLGLEPFDQGLNAKIFHNMLRERNGRLKSVLLDQTFLAGIGNIYADECLWRSKLHPQQRASSLLQSEAAELLRNIRVILAEAIEAKGTDAGDGVVEYGLYEPQVYGRDGKECLRCNSKVKRIVVGQRGTHLCTKCQKVRNRKP